MNILKNFLTIFISFFLILALIEIWLRLTGNNPRIDNLGREYDPVIYQKDQELGWIQKPGNYLFKPWSEEGSETNFSINLDGSRKLETNINSDIKILFFGGSLTQGWAVDDSQNFVNYFQQLN